MREEHPYIFEAIFDFTFFYIKYSHVWSKWLSFQKLLIKQSSSIRLHFYLDDFSVSNQDPYQIDIPGSGQSSLAGEPSVPIISAWLALPASNAAICSSKIIKAETLGRIAIENVAEPISRLNGQLMPGNQNKTLKFSDDFEKGILARAIPTTHLFNIEALNILFYPLQFNQADQSWTLIKEAEIELTFKKPLGSWDSYFRKST